MAPGADRSRGRGPRGRLGAVLVAVLASIVGAVVSLTVTAAPAAAHDALVSTAPSDGATVARTPTKVVLTFDQPALALGTAIIVTSPDGQQVQAGPPSLVDTTVTQALQPGAPAGPYTVSWRVTSVDGHPITGQLTFNSKAASAGDSNGGAAPATTPASQTPASGGAGGSGALLWVGLLAVLAVIGVILVLLRRSTERRET